MKKKPKKQIKPEKRLCENEHCGKVTNKGYEVGPWNDKKFFCDSCFEDHLRLDTAYQHPKSIPIAYKKMQK